MGRRWGKSVLGGCIGLGVPAAGGRVAWIVPNYSNGRPLWRMAENAVAPLVKRGVARANKSERVIDFPSTGGFLAIYSADNPSSFLGDAFNVVVVDEAARIDESVVTDAIEPTLSDFNGDLLLISTPKGLNWFASKHAEGLDAMDSRIAAWTAPTSANPLPNIQAAFKQIEQRTQQGKYPDRSFKQEWLAEFLAGGAYFQRVDECCTILAPDEPEQHRGHTISLGLDWGKSVDWTVATFDCRECDRTVDWDRFNGIEYRLQRERIKARVDRWTYTRCRQCGWEAKGAHEKCDKGHKTVNGIVAPRVLPERNSIGEVNIEELMSLGLQVELGPDGKPGYYMTETSKPVVIEMLYESFSRGHKFPKEYADEFRVFEQKSTSRGNSSYAAPVGMHDDRVISAALSNYLSTSALQIF